MTGTGWDLRLSGRGASGGAQGRASHFFPKEVKAEPQATSGATPGRWRQEQGAWGTGPPPTHSGEPHQPPCFFPRNFRKHLRMVGSRRVKAQSKTQDRRVGRWAALLSAGWGFAGC